MTNLYNILERIIDVIEFRWNTLRDDDAIIRYAESCGKSISTQEARLIMLLGLKWLYEMDYGDISDNWIYHEKIGRAHV